MEAIFKYDGKRAEKTLEGEESGGKKDNQVHLIKVYKARYKNDVKIDGKRHRKRRKKGGKRARQVKKGRKERWAICIYLEACKARFKCDVKIDGNKGENATEKGREKAREGREKWRKES
jgi:hypothetical protein